MSNDRFVEVTRRGYFQRLANSFGGIVIGFILVIAAFPLLWWNEGRAVKAQRGLDNATKTVVSIEPEVIDPAKNGHLVHVTGEAHSAAPIRDGDLGVVFNNVLVVTRTVEMFQWVEHKSEQTENEVGGSQRTVTTYTYEREWAEERADSAAFKHADGHTNPAMPLQSQSWAASETELGAFRLERDALLRLTAGEEREPATVPDGWRLEGYTLYRGDPASPQLGDLRATYTVLPSPAPVSLLARQMGRGFEPYQTPNGYEIFLVSDGIHSAEAMIQEQKNLESMTTWILRGVGLLMMWLGFCLIMGPLQALANILPFLANVAGFAIGLVALALTLPLSLGLIGVAWLVYRPVIGLAVLALGVGAGWALVKYRHRIVQPALPHVAHT